MIIMCGKPGEGIHRFRLWGVAVVDVALTVLASAIIAFAFKKNFFATTLLMFAIGVCVHAALGIDTALNVKLKSVFY